MRFSVDQESVSDVIAVLTSYSDEISTAYTAFQEEIKSIAIRTNYKKLLTALQHVAAIYHEDVCGSMREGLIRVWMEEGESLHSFAEDVYMGEEAEEAVGKIERHLEELFTDPSPDFLSGLEFTGDANATREDFDAAVACFERFRSEVERICDSNGKTLEDKIDENELYRFLIPVTQAIGAGITAFFETAQKNMEHLGDSYVEKMESLKEAAEEAKRSPRAPTLDLDLFDFDDDTSLPGGRFQAPKPAAPNVQNSAAASGAEKSPEQPQKYAALIAALKNFNDSGCTVLAQRSQYKSIVQRLEQNRQDKIAKECARVDSVLWNYEQKLALKREKTFQKLNREYISGKLFLGEAEYLFAQHCEEARVKYNLYYQRQEQNYWAKCRKINQAFYRQAQKYLAFLQMGDQSQDAACKRLYDSRRGYIEALTADKGAAQAIREIDSLLSEISRRCPQPCGNVQRIYQALEKSYHIMASSLVAPSREVPDPTSRPAPKLAGQSAPEEELQLKQPPKQPRDKNWVLKGFKRRQDSMTWEENLAAVNPNFQKSYKEKDGKYTRNCQRCVVAYEARCRGYDVTAKERILDGSDTLPIMTNANGWPSAFVDQNGNTPVPEPLNGKTTLEAIRDIYRRMASYGEGARAIIRIQRVASDGSCLSGHVFIAEQRNGKTVFCDPQTGRPAALGNFGYYNKVIGACQPREIVTCSQKCMKPGVKGPRSAELGECLECTDPKAAKDIKETTPVEVAPKHMRILRIDNLEMTKRALDCFQ